MSRILERLRSPEPFGKAGLTVAILALVLATTGAAFAAVGLNGKQKKEVEKIAKKFAGKPGAPGSQGPAGLEGKQGPAGKPGTNGTNGVDGEDGKSVVSTSFPGSAEPTGEPCGGQGGVEFEVEGSGSASYACNGNPASYPKTLPTGETEKGAWSLTTTAGAGPLGEVILSSPITFQLPLEGALNSLHVHYVSAGKEIVHNETSGEDEEVTSTACTGTVEEPTATAGNLCVYQKVAVGVKIAEQGSTELSMPKPYIFPAGKIGSFFGGQNGSAAFGAQIAFLTGEQSNHTTHESGQLAWGTWAVTAE